MIMILIFKTTRWPKTHTADIVQHGPDDLLSVLLPIQLQVNILLWLLGACILGVVFLVLLGSLNTAAIKGCNRKKTT